MEFIPVCPFPDSVFKMATKKNRGGWKQSEKQKAKARETMKRLRAAHPEKFFRKKKPAPQPQPAPEPAIKPDPQPAPEPAIKPDPQPAPEPAIKPDTDIFGHEEVQPPRIEPGSTELPKPPPGSPGSATAPAPAIEPSQDSRKYAVMVWGLIVKICVKIFGEGFQPMVLKSESGEILYDEAKEGVNVWWNWLSSIGVKAFSPVVELWIFMGSYFVLRFKFIVARFKNKKPDATGKPPHVSTEKAETTAPSKPEPQTAPAQPAPAQPATGPIPTATPGETDMVVEELL